jgi:hypothetical protein
MAMAAQAQKVTFFSPEFEMGVREHLGLEASADVLQTQTDTITNIDLSGLGISDIRDVVFLPAVEELNLSYNQLQDVSPLLLLDSLRYVDVSYNVLESVSILAMAQLDLMVVDVTNNYIEDFSYFFTPTLCWFTLVGMELQLVKDAPYFNVYDFYAAVNGQGRNTLTYRGYTNMTEPAYVECGGMRRAAQLDGETHTVLITDQPTSVVEARLSNGVESDTTWVLPPGDKEVAPGASLQIATGLPQNYTIVAAFVSRGATFVTGTDITYMAPLDFVSDTIFVGYSEKGKMRGYSRYCIGTPGSHTTLTGDFNDDGYVDVQDVVILIAYVLGNEPANINESNLDLNGDSIIDVGDVVRLIAMVLGNN